MEPVEPLKSLVERDWILSIMRRLGFVSVTSVQISSTSLLGQTVMLSDHEEFFFVWGGPILSIHRSIFSGLSSPATYKMRLAVSLWARFKTKWVKSVDFPIPGSPPMKTIEPKTMPPPSTRSNSSMPVPILWSAWSYDFTCESWIVWALAAPLLVPFALLIAVTTCLTCSSIEFQVPQSGHCPTHLGDSNPQF